MSSYGGFANPGQGAAVFTSEREIIAQGFDSRNALFKSVCVSGATRDAQNSPTTVLRPGLLLGKETATGKYSEWDADASDGTQDLGAVLWKELKATDFDGNNADRTFTQLVGKAPLQASQLLIQGTAFTSHVDEFLARRQLHAAGFTLDDDPFGYKAGQGSRMLTVNGDTTVTEDQNGTQFSFITSDADVTLPTIHPGLEYDFLMTADQELVVASAEGDNIIVGHDASADSVTFTTAGQQIGARVRVKSIYVSTTLKWTLELPNMAFGTGLTGGFAYAIATA